MVGQGIVSGDMHGDRNFLGRCNFTQGSSGLGLQVVKDAQIWYVDVNKTGPAVSGDGLSWDKAFLTVTEGIAALSNYDILMIGPGNYDELTKLTLTGLKGVKIFGFGTGMQWNEGSTCIRDVSHTAADDLLDITGCQSLEIAGISFINTEAKDAINFTGLNYSTHIHNCCFVGDVGGGAVQVYGVNIAGSNGPDTYIHNCKFFIQATAGILNLGQRNVITDNVFIVPTDGAGISGIDNVKGFNIIKDNYFSYTILENNLRFFVTNNILSKDWRGCIKFNRKSDRI